ncbi:MAG: ribonuclease Z [Flavobacteriales bacterium]|nr:ribonuclease Z [Flavobacteriales bacterium]
MNFDVHIMGCGAALPLARRMPTSQVINVSEQYFMVDCGEGTQLQVRKFKMKIQRIDHIFISHLHGDHYLGLPGLISTMHLLGRKSPLNVYGPKGIAEILEVNFKHSCTYLNFELKVTEIDVKESQVLLETSVVKVSTIILNHRVPCTGFLFEEKERPRKMLKDKIQEHNISVEEIIQLKKGKDVQRENELLSVDECTPPAPEPVSYAFCSDTKYDEKVADQIKGVHTLYLEATFLKAMKDMAKKTFHSTAEQAGMIAQKAGVKQLVLGHYSSRYSELELFKEEAMTQFSHVILAEDGLKIGIKGN